MSKKKVNLAAATIVAALSLSPAYARRNPARHHVQHHAVLNSHSFTAKTSWYERGVRTANGEHFNKMGFTAAHRTLPIGTRLLLSHGGHSVVVRVNDRGPAAWTGRSLDVSRSAAAALGLIKSGTGMVNATVLTSR